jgi:hypothetical protein
MPPYKNLTGERFGRLTVTGKYEKRGKSSNYYWECVCSCKDKTIIFVKNSHLKEGNTNSCGCLQKEKIKEVGKRNVKHGQYNTQFYRIWYCMKQRCNNSNANNYKHYGERGIKLQNFWNDFQNFYDDMYTKYRFAEKYYRKELKKKNNPLSIERKDVNGNYCKKNCCFIPKNKQSLNTRRTRWFVAFSPENKIHFTKNMVKFAEKYNLRFQAISRCLAKDRKTHRNWRFRFMTVKEKEIRGII